MFSIFRSHQRQRWIFISLTMTNQSLRFPRSAARNAAAFTRASKRRSLSLRLASGGSANRFDPVAPKSNDHLAGRLVGARILRRTPA